MPLSLRKDVRDSLENWVRSGYPNETCGLLIGASHEGVAVTARAVLARNLNQERARDRYELDPMDQLAAEAAARAAGLEVIGVWHSHPDHPARPSETDRMMAWPQWYYLIISVSNESIEDVRAWQLNHNGEFEEEAILP